MILDGRNNQGRLLGIDSLNLIDIGFSNYLLGFRDTDRKHVLKNIVYFELIRWGFDVSIGENWSVWSRFYCHKCKIVYSSNRIYEKPLQKIMITLDKAINHEYDGIESIDVIKWLLK